MDVLFFLEDRVRFIQQFYDSAATPFEERKRLIVAGEEPFVSPYDAEEPVFEAEWIDAEESLNWLGLMCLSMLSSSLHLFLKTWNGQIGLQCTKHFGKQFKERGWINAYKICFLERGGINWENSPSDLRLLEELVLTRNRVHHPESISSLRLTPLQADFKKLQNFLFFSDPYDEESLKEVQGNFLWKMKAPTISVTKEKLTKAAKEIQGFCRWLDTQIQEEMARQRDNASNQRERRGEKGQSPVRDAEPIKSPNRVAGGV